ncbi:MAG: hypothetical protein AB7O59_09155 [Pirellulales bacterium]
MRPTLPAVCGLLAWLAVGADALAESKVLPQALATLRQVEREGKTNRAASQAWAEIMVEAEPGQLPLILSAIDGADPLAANWLRALVDTIAERQLQSGGKLPTAALEKFLHEQQHDARARRLAYEWIARADPSAPDRLIPKMLDDPSAELRREAVARVIASADAELAAKHNDKALAEYQKALEAARDLDQVKAVTEALGKLEHPVNLSRHFGFLEDWRLVGPFSNVGGVGFPKVYPPEEAVDVGASYTGTSGPVSWISHHTDDEYAHVDLNKALGKHMGATAYAVAEFQSDRPQAAEIRMGSPNAVKIWLNGKLLAASEAYHANNVMDQYVGRGELVRGTNVILLKVCQNEQKEEWAQDWKFHVRVCDRLGKAILSLDRKPPQAIEKPAAAQAAK